MQRVEMIQTEDGAPDGVNVTRFQAGHAYNLPDGLAKRFIDQGSARPANAETENPEDGGGQQAEVPEPTAQSALGEGPTLEPGPETPETGPEGAPSDDQVVTAIRGLDPEDSDHWTNDGKPDVRAIADALDARVYAAQRDRVWATMQAEG